MRHPIGGFKVVYEFANGLSERGHEVNIIHPLLPFPEIAKFKNKLRMFSRLMLSSLLGTPRLSWFDISPKVNMLVVPSLEEKHIPPADIIIATAWQTAEWVNRYDLNKGEKFYLIQHYETWSGSEERVKPTWKMPLRKIVVARWLEKIACEMGENRVTYVPRGIDFKQFHITKPIEKRIPKIISMFYHKLDWKGAQDGITALKIVKDKVTELQPVFFSICPKDAKVPEWVEYHHNPPQSELREIYNSCAIYLNPCWSGEWGLTTAEAMACGCAVVCTDSDGAAEYGFHEKTALVSKPKDPQTLAQNILRLLEDDDLRIRLAKAGYDLIQKFTWEKSVTILEEVLR